MNALKIAITAMTLMALIGLVSAGSGNSVPTNADLSGCSNPPWIKAKFELNDDADPEHNITGTQVLPVAGGDKLVEIYVVACDENGQDDIQMVHVGVAWPSPSTDTHESDGVKITNQATVEGILQDAVDQGLITEAQRDDILVEIFSEQVCNLYKEEVVLDNCDPSGMYTVTAVACDHCGAASDPFMNDFEYISIVSVDIDFTGLNYGLISVGIEKKIPGDQ
ncbi:MAG: hypothetical protein ABH851_05280, partial [Methanobacteriota archaeon]